MIYSLQVKSDSYFVIHVICSQVHWSFTVEGGGEEVVAGEEATTVVVVVVITELVTTEIALVVVAAPVQVFPMPRERTLVVIWQIGVLLIPPSYARKQILL